MNETEYWLNLEKNYDELIEYTRKLEDENEKMKNALTGLGLDLLKQYLDNSEVIGGAENE